MSLFGSIQMAGGALQANDIALQVVGQNIANANTPGYIREMANLSPGPTQRVGNLPFGTGVYVQSITQQVDKFLEERLRSANGDQVSADTLKQTYNQLETIVGALDSTNSLGGAINQFVSSLSNILNQPESTSIRNMAVLQGQSLTQTIRRLDSQVVQLSTEVNGQIDQMTTGINALLTKIGTLNDQIAQIQGGGASHSDAVGLSDQRSQALADLSKLIGISTITQPDGSVSVYSGNEYLVFGTVARQVKSAYSSGRDGTIANIQIAGIDAPLTTTSGQLNGLLTARDDVLAGFQNQLDSFAGTLANEFNKVFSSGQGTSGYTQLSSQNAVSDANQPLDKAGLAFTPQNGSFQIIVKNMRTGDSTTTDILVPLLDAGHTTTLTSLAGRLNSVTGLQATVTNGKLAIGTTDPNVQFAFANDTSGVLAALGLNTFFTGSTAGDIGVNSVVAQDPSKFAASAGGIGVDSANAATLAGFVDLPLASQNGNSINTLYSNLVGGVAQNSANAKSMADAADTFQSTLQTQQLAVSGVNIDEEAIQMMSYQRAYQASAKFISTVNDLLSMLVQL